jgi:hypothetical protein
MPGTWSTQNFMVGALMLRMVIIVKECIFMGVAYECTPDAILEPIIIWEYGTS